MKRHIQIVGCLFTACAMAIGVAEAQSLDIRVVSEREVVFDWQRDRCEDSDIPDTALNVFRRADGQLVGFDTHWNNRRFFIDKDHRFHRDCKIVFKASENPDPAAFDDKIWIAAPWTEDGQTVYALGHNEYQGHAHPGRCAFKSYAECWYNSIVLLKSTNGGGSFARVPGAVPVASAAFRFDAMQGEPRGFFEPTNAVRSGDHLYAIIYTTGGNSQKRGNCLFRTRRFGGHASWEYWTGNNFAPSRGDPYSNPTQVTPSCEPLQGLKGRVSSIRLHRPSGLYLATVAAQPAGAAKGTIAISMSRDLYRWGRPIPLLSVPLIWSKNCSDTFRYAYPSLIDLDSPDRNLSDVGTRAELYMTEIRIANCGTTLDRKLVRYRIGNLSLPVGKQ